MIMHTIRAFLGKRYMWPAVKRRTITYSRQYKSSETENPNRVHAFQQVKGLLLCRRPHEKWRAEVFLSLFKRESYLKGACDEASCSVGSVMHKIVLLFRQNSLLLWAFGATRGITAFSVCLLGVTVTFWVGDESKSFYVVARWFWFQNVRHWRFFLRVHFSMTFRSVLLLSRTWRNRRVCGGWFW